MTTVNWLGLATQFPMQNKNSTSMSTIPEPLKMRALIGRLAVEVSTKVMVGKSSAFKICKESYGITGNTKISVAKHMIDIYRMKYPDEPPISKEVLNKLEYNEIN